MKFKDMNLSQQEMYKMYINTYFPDFDIRFDYERGTCVINHVEYETDDEVHQCLVKLRLKK